MAAGCIGRNGIFAYNKQMRTLLYIIDYTMMAYIVIINPLSDFYLGITAAVKQSELKETFHGR